MLFIKFYWFSLISWLFLKVLNIILVYFNLWACTYFPYFFFLSFWLFLSDCNFFYSIIFPVHLSNRFLANVSLFPFYYFGMREYNSGPYCPASWNVILSRIQGDPGLSNQTSNRKSSRYLKQDVVYHRKLCVYKVLIGKFQNPQESTAKGRHAATPRWQFWVSAKAHAKLNLHRTYTIGGA